MIEVLPIASGGFLLAVLWFDLMFDVQTLRHPQGDLPDDVLSSIAGYYRRVTIEASPMGHAVALAMVIGVVAVVTQLFTGSVSLWAPILSLVIGVPPMVLAGVRVVPNAMRLGRRSDPVDVQSALARKICRDHFVCLAAIAGFLLVQLVAAS